MKKFASILLALVLCVAMAVPAFAVESFSSHLNTSHAPTGTITFRDFSEKERTATVFPAGTVVSLNTEDYSLLQFNNVSNAQDPFESVGIDAWSVTEFTLQAGIIYSVETFDGSSFAGESFYMTAEGGTAEPTEPETPAEPERLPAPTVTNKAGKTTIQANSWSEGGLMTMVFETLKVEKVSLPGPGSSAEYLVLVLKPGSKLPYIDAMSPMRMVDEGFYVSDGIYPGASGVAEDLFVPTFPGLPACEYVGIWGTEYDLPVLLTLPADEPEAPAATTTPEPAPEPSAQPEPSPEPEAPVEDEPAPEPSAEPETPVEDQPAPAPSAEPEAPAEDQPAPAPSAEPEAPAADEAPADTAPVAPETPEAPAVPVEDNNSFPIGIVVAIVAVVVIAAVAVVVLKKKK